MKKILIITTILVVLGIGGYLAWQYFFQPTPTEVAEEGAALPITEAGITPTEKRPAETQITKAGIKILSTRPVFDYWINKNTNDVYFVDLNGEMHKISPSGTEEKINAQTISDIHSIQPSPDGSRVIFTFGYPFQTTLSILDIAAKSWQPLPAGTISAAWDPRSNNQISYLKDNSDKSGIFLLTLSTKKATELIKVNQKDLDLEWALPDVLYLKTKPSAEYNGFIWAFNIKQKTFSPLINEGAGLSVLWSDNGKLGCRFSGNGFTNSFTLIDEKNRVLANISDVTLPSKCAFGINNAYCAIPIRIPPRVKLPDDYLQKEIFLDDLIYKVDLTTGETEQFGNISFNIFTPPMDAYHLSIQKNRLLFINRLDNLLYSLDL
ncbi:MAG: hypothetical protein AAB454_00790 [Patescibacteria group bacterium]